jgi:two-component system, cell cycle sensor histidine kinase and response regulator CckA
MDILARLFDTSGFPPRWKCGSGWHDDPWLGWLHIISDLAVWSAYFAIPGILAYFVLRKKDLPFRKIFLLFVAFILFCGTTHLMEAIIFWWPAYGLAGLIKMATAAVSWATIFALVQVTPQALSMRSPEELEREVGARTRAEQELTKANAELQKQIEALRASEERFRLLVQGTKDYAFILLDAEGKVASWNVGAERLNLHRDEEIVGRPFAQLFPSEVVETGRPQRALEIAAKIGTHEEEGRQIRKDGSQFWANTVITALRGADNRLQGYSTIICNVTEKKQADENRRLLQEEEAARRAAEDKAKFIQGQREQLRVTLHSIGDAVIAVDAQGRVEFLNPIAQELTGWSDDEARNRPLEEVFRIVNEHNREPVENPALRSLQEGIIVGLANHTLLISKDGAERPVADSAAPIRDAEGKVIGVVLVFRDVTEQKRQEERSRQTQKMEAVGQLAGGVAHDFNNLLTVILGYCRYLEDDPALSPDNRERAKEIHKAGERAADLTRQLLAFGRQQLLRPTVLNLNHVVADTGKMLKRLISEDVSIVTALTANPWMVHVDQGQIAQVIVNLAVNSRDAMPDGGKLTIETGNVELGESDIDKFLDVKPGRYVQLTVGDTGCGMDQATMARIFEPFFTTKEPGKGTGLGLATVFGIVKQSGGHITVQSEPGRGATFQIYLPAADGAPTNVPDPSRTNGAAGGSETVLVVEDADMVRKLACDLLRQQGYVVLEARNGREALQLCDRYGSAVHLLLTDVIMPEMGGCQLAEHVRKRRPSLKVLYMSGYTDDAVLHNGELEADAGFIQKPFSPEALSQKVRDILDR